MYQALSPPHQIVSVHKEIMSEREEVPTQVAHMPCGECSLRKRRNVRRAQEGCLDEAFGVRGGFPGEGTPKLR